MGDIIEAVTRAGGEVRFTQSGDGLQCFVRRRDGKTFDEVVDPHPDPGAAAEKALKAAHAKMRSDDKS
jgi:hypothetical protein